MKSNVIISGKALLFLSFTRCKLYFEYRLLLISAILSRSFLYNQCFLLWGTDKKISSKLTELEELVVLFSLLNGTNSLPVGIGIPESLHAAFIPCMDQVSFKKVPRKEGKQQKRFIHLLSRLGDRNDSLKDAKYNVLWLLKEAHQRSLETSSFAIIHYSFMVKKIGGLLFTMIVLMMINLEMIWPFHSHV